MARYRYKARQKDGKEVKGWMEAKDEETLAGMLHQKGLTVISLKDTGAKIQSGWFPAPLTLAGLDVFAPKIKTETLLVFIEQLSAMVGAGIPLIRVLRSLSQETPNKKFREILEGIFQDVSAGVSFSDALARYPSVFDQLFIDLVKAGEATGKLGVTLTQLVEYMESRAGIRGKIKSALVYPIIITLFSIIVVMVLALWIIPKFQGIYQGMGAELPLPTRILIGVTGAIQSYFLAGSLLVGMAGILLWIFIKTPRGRRMLDRFKLAMPIFGDMFRKDALSIFSRTMGTLLSSGIPVIQAIEMSCRSVNNKIIEEASLRTADRIEKGRSIVESFKEEKVFPDMLNQMIASGEETGNLGNIIVKASDFYDRQLDAFATAFTALIEPVLLFIIGSVVGGMVISMFLPMFKMAKVMH